MVRIQSPLFASLLALGLLACQQSNAPASTSPDGGTRHSDGDSTLPDDDAGGAMMADGGGATPLPTAPTIDVTLSAACEGFTPCGGDVVGTWAYTDGCVQVDLSDVRDACPAATIDATATASGVVRIDAFTVERESTVSTEASIGIPASCNVLGCAMLAGLLASGGDASCTDTAAGGCDCTLSRTAAESEADGYHLEGNSLITDGGRIYDYCRDGDTIIYGEQGDADVFELSPL